MYIHDDITDIIAVYIKMCGDIVLFGICVCMAIFISKNCTPRVLKVRYLNIAVHTDIHDDIHIGTEA